MTKEEIHDALAEAGYLVTVEPITISTLQVGFYAQVRRGHNTVLSLSNYGMYTNEVETLGMVYRALVTP